MPDEPPRRPDPSVGETEPAHLRDERGFTPPVHRLLADPVLTDLVRRYWVPVWSLPPGEVSVQRVLRYPVCLVVVADHYARFYGPATGLSHQELRGEGWACGVMLQPAAGSLLLGGPVGPLVDQVVGLVDPDAVAGWRRRGLQPSVLVDAVRARLVPDPGDPARRDAACALLGEELTRLLPVDEEGRLVNAVVEHVEQDPAVLRVSDVAERFDLTERSLQRLLVRRVGVGPKWLVRRRRLQDAAGRLAAEDPPSLADVAAELGYADQAHFGRDFRAVTGLTPRQYARQPRPPASSGRSPRPGGGTRTP